MPDMEEIGQFDIGRLTFVGWLLSIAAVVSAISIVTYVVVEAEKSVTQAQPNGDNYTASETPKKSFFDGLSSGGRKAVGLVIVGVIAVFFVGARYALEAIGLTVIRPLAVKPPPAAPPANPYH